MVDLNELLRIAGAIILVDVSGLEFFWPDNLTDSWRQSTEIAHS
jgi:ABC-type phosphate transport system auxiliary subunit